MFNPSLNTYWDESFNVVGSINSSGGKTFQLLSLVLRFQLWLLEINKRSNGKAEEFSPGLGCRGWSGNGCLDRQSKATYLGVFSQAVVLSTSGLSRVYMPRGRSDWKRSPRGLVCQRRSKKARENQGSILGTALKSYRVVFCFSLKTFFFF